MMIQNPKLHLYTGNGKGKTTAAMGLAMRVLGHGGSVLIAQWMKDGTSGELLAFQTFEHVTLLSFPPMNKFTYEMSQQEFQNEKQVQTSHVQTVLNALRIHKPTLMIFDELAMAMHCGLVSKKEGLSLIQAGLSLGEVVTTGYQAPEALQAIADYVSVITCQKHPFVQNASPARKGVEW